MRNTDPHQNHSSSRPPMSGPIAPPAEKLAIHTPIAKVRSRGCRNMFRISDNVEGASVAPAIPSSARATISIGALVENAATTERRPNAPAPTNSSRRRPIRSPSVPIGIRKPASRKP
jgi:hypothetical protein